MKCPHCHLAVTEDTSGEYYRCRGCHYFFKSKLVEAHQEKVIFQTAKTFYARDVDPKAVFKVAEEKFNSDTKEVIGIYMNMAQRNLLMGQQWKALIRKKK